MFDQQGVIAMDDDHSNAAPKKPLTRKQRRAARQAWRREYQAARYQERLAGPLCMRAGCTSAKADGSAYCAHCEPEVKERRAANEEARRARFAAKGLCPYCRLPKQRNTMVQLAAHPVATPARWHTDGKRNVVRQVTEGDGRTRNRSSGRGKRGGMGNAANDELDAKLARAEFDRFEQAIAILHSPEVQALGRLERDSAARAALAHLDLHDRLVEQIRDRLTKKLR